MPIHLPWGQNLPSRGLWGNCYYIGHPAIGRERIVSGLLGGLSNQRVAILEYVRSNSEGGTIIEDPPGLCPGAEYVACSISTERFAFDGSMHESPRPRLVIVGAVYQCGVLHELVARQGRDTLLPTSEQLVAILDDWRRIGVELPIMQESHADLSTIDRRSLSDRVLANLESKWTDG